MLQVQAQMQHAQPVELIIRNVNGSLLERRRLQGVAGVNNWQVARAATWSPGMYILELHMGNEVLRNRFVVQ
jgi:hypothetical protein